jgi:WD40 repeat protein
MINRDLPETEIVFCEVAMPYSVRSWRADTPKTNELAKKIPARSIFSPDGQWLAIGTAYGVRLMSVPAFQPHATLGSNEIYAVRFSAGGDRLFAAGKDGQRVWDLTPLTSAAWEGSLGKAGGLAANHSHVPGQEERQLTLGPDGRPLAVLRGMRAFHRSDATAEWQPVREPGEHEWMTTSRDGAWMALAGPTRLRLLHLSDQACLWETKIHGLCRFDFSPDSQSLLALDAERLRCFDTISGEVRWHVPRLDPYLRVGDVAWSADGRWIAAALVRPDVSLIEAATGRVAVRLANPTETSVSATAFSPNGRYLAVTLVDQSAQLWDLDTLRQQLATLGLDWKPGH